MVSYTITISREDFLMESTGVNYWAVLVAGVAFTALGALWYSPALFFNAWLKGIGKTREQIEAGHSPWKMVVALIGSLVAAYGIARALSWTNLEHLWGGVAIAFLAAVCFLATTMGTNDLMEGRPLKLYLLNAFFNLIGFLIMGVIIGVWK